MALFNRLYTICVGLCLGSLASSLWAKNTKQKSIYPPELYSIFEQRHYRYSVIKDRFDRDFNDDKLIFKHSSRLSIPFQFSLDAVGVDVFTVNNFKFSQVSTDDKLAKFDIWDSTTHFVKPIADKKYSLLASAGFIRNDYSKHMLSHYLLGINYNNGVDLMGLNLNRLVLRYRAINHRNDYIILVYLDKKFSTGHVLNIIFPSEAYVSQYFGSSVLRYGLRTEGLENMFEHEGEDYWQTGFNAHLFVKWSKELSGQWWLGYEVGSAFEQSKVFSNSAEEIGQRQLLSPVYFNLSIQSKI